MLADIRQYLGLTYDSGAFAEWADTLPFSIEDSSYICDHKAGVSFLFRDSGRQEGYSIYSGGGGRQVTSVFLYGPGEDPDYAVYQGPIPFGVKFTDSAGDVKAKLSCEPSLSGGGGDAKFTRCFFDRYDLDGYSLHFKFTEGGKESIQIVTCMAQVGHLFRKDQDKATG